jgi:hypothetical protein
MRLSIGYIKGVMKVLCPSKILDIYLPTLIDRTIESKRNKKTNIRSSSCMIPPQKINESKAEWTYLKISLSMPEVCTLTNVINHHSDL